MTRTLPLALVLLITLPAFAQEAPLPPKLTGTRLEVTADANIKAVPDMATVSSGVVTQAPTASEAMSKNAAAMTKVFDALKKAGIKETDIQTSGLSLNPDYAYEEKQAPRITGYQANNNVSVVLHDLTKVGATLDTLVSVGANQI